MDNEDPFLLFMGYPAVRNACLPKVSELLVQKNYTFLQVGNLAL